jgi:hypothetical protein
LDKSGRYEVTPVQLRIPAVNHLAEGTLSAGTRARSEWSRELSQAPSRGLSTLSTNVQQAADRRRWLIAACERLIQARDLPALYRIIDANAELALDHLIRSAVLKLSEAARYRSGPGRKAHSHQYPPLLMVGLVSDLIQAGKAENPEQAFHVLQDLNISTCEAARRQYYRTLADPRFRGLLIELGQAQGQSAKEAESIMQAGEWLRRGGQIRRSVYVSEIGGAAEVIIRATEDGPKGTQKASPTDEYSDNTLVVTQIRIDGLKGPTG